jgi:uncharacterized membrane protein YuzA (DUF378 family)
MDEDDDSHWMVDLSTLMLVLLGGVCLGALGFFGIDVLAKALGATGSRIAEAAIGLSAVWQLFRQRLT